MSFKQGNVYSATTPASDLRTAIKSLLDVHPAWTFVETVLGTPTTRITDVYKCKGSVNSFGTDFYIGLHQTAETLWGVVMGETYDVATHKFGKIAPYTVSAASAVLTAETDLSYLTARHAADETNLVAQTNGFLKVAGGGSGATTGMALSINLTTPYVISVTNDRLVVGVWSASTSYALYAGLYDSFHSTALDPFPILLSGCTPYLAIDSFQQNGAQSGAFTREGASGQFLGAFAGQVSPHPWTRTEGHQRQWLTINKEPISQRWWPSRVMAVQTGGTGGLKGLLKPDVIVLTMQEYTEAIQEHMTIDGVDYCCFFNNMSPNILTTAGSSSSPVTRSLWVSTAA